jgi:hypothetical protein
MSTSLIGPYDSFLPETSPKLRRFLYGFAVDLDIPYFQYANLNFYRANNENIDDDYPQVVLMSTSLIGPYDSFLPETSPKLRRGDNSK